MTSDKIIFIDDDRDLLAAQSQGLELAGFSVRAFGSGVEALRHVSPDFDGVVLSDVRMPQMDGLAILRRIQSIDSDLPVILLTGHGDVPMAVQALKDGAYDFLTKPFAMEELVQSLKRAISARRLVVENRQLRQLHADRNAPQTALMGNSPMIVQLRHNLTQIAEAEVDLLITGDTGTGKESVARALHRLSPRRTRPLVHINCAALNEDSFDAELFGVEPGAKSGGYSHASRRTTGRLEKAHRGTLFLDDVDGLTPLQQAKVLRLIEAREIWPVGADEGRPLDARVIAASKINLSEAVRAGAFRADLFYRLSGVSVRVPSLMERKEDIRLLFQHFLVSACARLKRPVPQVTSPVQAYMQSHTWPGNVRELEHFAERFALGLEEARLPGTDAGPDGSLANRVARFEADLIRETLSLHKGNAQAAMTDLQLARKTFYDKLQRFDIAIRAYRK